MTRRALRWALPSAAAAAVSALTSSASAFMTPCPSSSGGGGGTARVVSGRYSTFGLGQGGSCSGGRLEEVSQCADDRRRRRHYLPNRQGNEGGTARHRTGGAMSMLNTVVEGQRHTYEVVFVRHGQSTWNKANRFIGWTDAELTEEGEIEARVAGQVLLSEGFEFDVVYTSMLKRAIKTAWVVLDELSQQYVPVLMDWHLNERCYGALVGREKKECVRHFGAEQIKTWRRSYDIPPPPIDRSSKLWPGNNPRYNFLMKDGESQVPVHESLKDVMKRSSVYWDEVIAPSIRAGKRVCICGHENNLRSLLKHVDGVSAEDIINVELPRAVPLVYYLDENLRPIDLAGSAPYLRGEYVGDPEEIAGIMDRDLRNVYDLSVSQNLEEAGSRFAVKLEELAQPCSVDDFGGDAAEGEGGQFTGTFLETGVGEDSCRSSEITSTPLLLYNRGQHKPCSDTAPPNSGSGSSGSSSSSSSSTITTTTGGGGSNRSAGNNASSPP